METGAYKLSSPEKGGLFEKYQISRTSGQE